MIEVSVTDVMKDGLTMSMNHSFVFYLSIILMIFIVLWAAQDSAAMTVCQVDHNFDTCFTNLNR